MNDKEHIYLSEKEATDLFLRKLSSLSKKYKVSISGCGCCGSPSLDTHIFKSKKEIDAYDKCKYYYKDQMKFGIECKKCGEILDWDESSCWNCR